MDIDVYDVAMLIYRPVFPRQRTRFHRERAATERGAGRAAGGARAAARLTFRVAVTVLAAADVDARDAGSDGDE